jgi:hypothetical protein
VAGDLEIGLVITSSPGLISRSSAQSTEPINEDAAVRLRAHLERLKRIRERLVGAIVTALLLLAISLAAGLIYERTTSLSVVYGSLTAALVFLYSMYLYSSALLLGAEVAAAWARPPTGNGEPILTRVKRGVLGLFVKQAQGE